MTVEKVFGIVDDGYGWKRTVLKTDGSYTPYVVCTGYNADTQSWASAYGYYHNKQELAECILKFIADGGYFEGELVF